MNKKDMIIKILIVVIVLLIIGLVVFKLVKKNDNSLPKEPGVEYPTEAEIATFEYKLREMVDSINFINQVFREDASYSKEDAYINKNTNESCEKYTGESPEMVINVIDTIYEDPFSLEKRFHSSEKEDGSLDLYVCKPSSCKSKELTIDDIVIKEDKSDSEKIIKIDEKEYTIKKIDEIWKISEPVIFCEK